MTHHRSLMLAVLILPLSACGREKAPDEADSPTTTAQPAHSEPAAPWDAKAKADRNAASIAPPSGAPTSPEPDVGQRANRIPASVQGRWGLVAADCTTTRGDAKGLLTIDATSLRFYESVGKLTRVRERDANRIVGDFAFSGEGMTWNRSMTLDVEGQTLIRRENGDGAAPGPFQYTRCKG